MPLPPPKNRTSYGTYLYFAEPGTLETFLRDYRQILTTHFQKFRIEGGGEYWSCGQEHDPRNWNWKPWQHLERLCRKQGLDDFGVRDILFEHLGRNLACECQVLYDKRELRKEALKRQFGVDLDGGEVGLIDLTGTANPFHPDIRFLYRFLTSDDRLVKFPLSKKKSGYGQEVQLRKKDRQRGYEKV